MEIKNYIETYLCEVKQIVDKIDKSKLEEMIKILIQIRERKGRLFIIGVGGSAGSCTHAVNDFRKIAGIETYAPTDNVSELTARVNDEGWESVFVQWLKVSKLNSNDCIMVFSVGGGNEEKNVSTNIVQALKLAKEIGVKVIGVVGKDGGYTGKIADACVIIPTISNETITPHAESFQGILWHMIVSHPVMKVNEMKWESTK